MEVNQAVWLYCREILHVLKHIIQFVNTVCMCTTEYDKPLDHQDDSSLSPETIKNSYTLVFDIVRVTGAP